MVMGGVTATTAEELSVGAGELFYRITSPAVGLWLPCGPTIDDNVWRHTQEIFTPEINGAGALKGTDYQTAEGAELEFSPIELNPVIMAALVPGSTSTTETAAPVGGGWAGGLDAPIAAGQSLAIKIDSVVSAAIGDFIRVGPVGAREIRKVTRVGTVGGAGTGIDVEYPFLLSHADTETFEEVDGSGATIIVPGTQRRLPSTSYRDWRLDVPGLDGRIKRYFLYDGLMTDNADVEASDDAVAAPRFTIASRIDPANPNRGGWAIRVEPIA